MFQRPRHKGSVINETKICIKTFQITSSRKSSSCSCNLGIKDLMIPGESFEKSAEQCSLFVAADADDTASDVRYLVSMRSCQMK